MRSHCNVQQCIVSLCNCDTMHCVTLVAVHIALACHRLNAMWHLVVFDTMHSVKHIALCHSSGRIQCTSNQRYNTGLQGHSFKIVNGYFLLHEKTKSMLPQVWLCHLVYFMMNTIYVIDNNHNFYSKFHPSHFL